ncbi:MAG: hypothetical protein EXX96DRAFT_242768 [Benjaminiella poitrasii]|nr:MAG: hypothetical protein EXX96DRAFT_242768 [Benjaminiella poitrasii]
MITTLISKRTTSTVTTSPIKTLLDSVTLTFSLILTSPKQWCSSFMSFVVYASIGTCALLSLGSIFTLFFAITFIDDCLCTLIPAGKRFIHQAKNQIDWIGFVDRLSHQLTQFAEWEKGKRTSWYEYYNTEAEEDSFHLLISTIIEFMNEYVAHRKRHEEYQKKYANKS